MARDETKNLKEHIKGTRFVNLEDSQALDPASWNLRDLMTCLDIQRAFGRPAANATGQGGVLAVGNDSTADVGDEGDVECNEYRAAGKVDVEGTGILDHRNRPRTAPAVEIRYLFDKDFSRKCSTSKDDFDKCLRILEQDMLPLPTSVRTNVDPRECFNMDRWRFAVEEELGLTSKWRRDDRKGFLLRLTAIRLRAEDDWLHCWPVPILGLYCTLEDVTKFVNTHPVCQLEYCIDFQSEENVIEWDSMLCFCGKEHH
ncbi:unnamed protein product [Cercospora beticola]|nr:unnamed protein product [Cercospora beticola]